MEAMGPLHISLFTLEATLFIVIDPSETNCQGEPGDFVKWRPVQNLIMRAESGANQKQKCLNAGTHIVRCSDSHHAASHLSEH